MDGYLGASAYDGAVVLNAARFRLAHRILGWTSVRSKRGDGYDARVVRGYHRTRASWERFLRRVNYDYPVAAVCPPDGLKLKITTRRCELRVCPFCYVRKIRELFGRVQKYVFGDFESDVPLRSLWVHCFSRNYDTHADVVTWHASLPMAQRLDGSDRWWRNAMEQMRHFVQDPVERRVEFAPGFNAALMVYHPIYRQEHGEALCPVMRKGGIPFATNDRYRPASQVEGLFHTMELQPGPGRGLTKQRLVDLFAMLFPYDYGWIKGVGQDHNADYHEIMTRCRMTSTFGCLHGDDE